MSPEIVEPDFETVLDTTTPMNDGTVSGGPELLPGLDDQLPPHTGGELLSVSAKPLKLAVAAPPLSVLSSHHCAPQKVTAPAALPSPRTNEPCSRKAKMSVAAEAEDGT